MPRLICLAFLAVVGANTTLFEPNANLKHCKCGVSNVWPSSFRIVGGAPLFPHEHPWLAVLFLHNTFHCGASLINDRYVLTAAHCVAEVPPIELTVGLGEHDLKRPGYVRRRVEGVILHDKFGGDDLRDINDIALLKVAGRVDFGEDMGPVCLPGAGSDHVGNPAVVAGWGRVAALGGASDVPLETTVVVMDDEFCFQSKIGSHFSDSMLCAYGLNRDACQGDSGGPLVYMRPTGRYEVIGLVSWGIGCGEMDIPGVYTKVANFVEWIAENTKDGIYCEMK